MEPFPDSSDADAPGGCGPARLSKAIAALRVIVSDQGGISCGGISELPEGAEVDVCGEGFNPRTVTVRCQGEFFFAFRQDLEPDELSAYSD